MQACAALGEFEEALAILEGMIAERAAPPGSPTNARALLETHAGRLRASVQERDREQGR
jgi:pentatricopeptide repeat protein